MSPLLNLPHFLVGHQGEMIHRDQSNGDTVFPNLESSPPPICSSIDHQPCSIPSPQAPIYSSSSHDHNNDQAALEQAASQKLPSLVRYKGSPYVFKRRQPNLEAQHAPTSVPSQGMDFIQPSVTTLG